MDVKAIAGPVAKGLAMKAGGKAVLAGDALHRALEQHGVVRRPQGVGDMVQVDLELADAFSAIAVSTESLRPQALVDVVDEGLEIVDLRRSTRCVGIERRPGDR